MQWHGAGVWTMSLGLLGGYGSSSASGSEISDSEEEERERVEEGGGTVRSCGSCDSEEVEAGKAQQVGGVGRRQVEGEWEEEGGGVGVEEGEEEPSTSVRSEKNEVEREKQEEEGGKKEKVQVYSKPVSYYGLGAAGEDCTYSDSSTSGGEVEEEEWQRGERDNLRSASPLPLPDLEGSEKNPSSVFSNPYREAEEAKLAVLKQHVALSQAEEASQDRRRRGKWSRRGRGRAHRRETGEITSPLGDRGESNQWFDDKDASKGGQEVRRKHRSGLTGTLLPPKKFMKSHHEIRSHEHPWNR